MIPTLASPNHKWYIIHTLSGQEDKVKATLERKLGSTPVGQSVDQIIIPTEEHMELVRGKRKVVKRKIYPGYILINMNYNPTVWHVIKSTHGVMGFLGERDKPTPLPEGEANSILKRAGLSTPKLRIHWKVGDGVRVLQGPFASFTGMVKELDEQKERVTVLLTFLGRETPVELNFDQIEQV